jgi:hypothetical protein
LRELRGDDAGRVLFAAGLGVAPERHPLGLATDGRLAVAVHGGPEMGALVIGADGALSMMRADDLPPLGPHDDLVELPLLLWDGARAPAIPSGALVPRAAIGVAPGGRILLARGSFTNAQPLVDALVAGGCTRALALDRGVQASAFLDRAGTQAPPRSRYDESVLYAVGIPLAPRASRFEASTLVAQAPKPKSP